MNISDKLLTEAESLALAGVSIDTLNKYSEIGLLDAVVKESQKFYYENDIKTLFYAQLKAKSIQTQESTQNPLPTENKTNVVSSPSLNDEATTFEEAISSNNTSTHDNGKTNLAVDTFFPSSLELLEINKSLREQIQIYREERNWLRERIEKLETRSEREQMLLLSESENLRNLIKANKKGFWEKALPWFGNNK